MNNITVAGNLGKDAELRRLPDGTGILNFAIADSQGKDKNAIWWECSIFGKRAESLSQYLVKGQTVTVSGSVSEREYVDKDGANRTARSVRVADLALQGGRQTEQRSAPSAPPQKQAPSDMSDLDSDIPF